MIVNNPQANDDFYNEILADQSGRYMLLKGDSLSPDPTDYLVYDSQTNGCVLDDDNDGHFDLVKKMLAKGVRIITVAEIIQLLKHKELP